MSAVYKSHGSFVNLFSGQDEQCCITLDRMKGDSLKVISDHVDFEKLRPLIEEIVENFKSAEASRRLPSPHSPVKASRKRGRPSEDPVLMFKILLVKKLFDLSDLKIASACLADLRVRRFLDIAPDSAPSPKTIWKYQEIFTKSGLFQSLSTSLMDLIKGVMAQPSVDRAIDSSFTEAPKQRNSPEENKLIKAGKGDLLWNDQPAKKRQKDIDARWTKKRGETHYGYKMHVKVLVPTKLIVAMHTTPASTHDSQVIAPLLDKHDAGANLYADAGYAGRAQEALIRSFQMNPVICEKGYRGHPLTEEQKVSNRRKSSQRCRIEHVFAFVENSLHGAKVRTIGMMRAASHHWMIVFCYNLCRLIQLSALGKWHILPQELAAAPPQAALARP